MMKVKEIWIDMDSGRTYFLEEEGVCTGARIEYINFADLLE